LTVLRFSNLDVLQNIDAVMEKIFVEIGEWRAFLINSLN
jgi:very-short-patch-repair endonuclease